MPVERTAWITALLFGLVLGWSVARNPADRALGTRAVVVMIVIGVVTWLLGPDPGTQPATAAVSMTFAGASALASALAIGARANPR